MDLDVHDEQELFEAARKHAREREGMGYEEAEELLRPSGEIDRSACLIMLIDPGTLPGCSINETYCPD
jgi:hypothetical protein